MLAKLIEIISDVNIENSSLVLRRLGFEVPYNIDEQANFTTYRPASKVDSTKQALPAELESTGLIQIEAQQVHAQNEKRIHANFSVVFSKPYICITVEDVKSAFAPQATMRRSAIVTTDGPSPGSMNRCNDTSVAVFERLRTPLGAVGFASFVFDYQKCAERVWIGYGSLLMKGSSK